MRDTMDKSDTLAHYTLTTGHMEASPRSAVADDTMATLRPMLTDGDHVMPGFGGYSVATTTHGSRLRACVRGPHGATIVMDVVCAAEDLARLGRQHKRELNVPLPACLVEILPAATVDPAVHWVGDFERCLAWAWVEHVEQRDAPIED